MKMSAVVSIFSSVALPSSVGILMQRLRMLRRSLSPVMPRRMRTTSMLSGFSIQVTSAPISAMSSAA